MLGEVFDFLGDIVSAGSAKRINDKQLEFSKHAMQYRVDDLKAAGLNPMLAVGTSGAQTPNLTNPGEAFRGAGGRYNAAKIARAQQDLINEQANQASSAAALSEANIRNVQQDTERKSIENDILRLRFPFSAANAQAEADMLRAQADAMGQEVLGRKLSNSQLEKIQPLLLEYQELINKAEAYGLPEKEAAAKFFETVPGAKWIGQISSILGVDAGRLMGIFRKKGPHTVIDKSVTTTFGTK